VKAVDAYRLQIYLQPRVTLIFDFLTPKVGRFMPFCVDHWCQLASKSLHWFLQRDAMHSADYTLAGCLSVRLSACLSHAGIPLKLLNISSNFFIIR